MKDLYEVLRVHPNVSQDEIKEAYRRLAHKYHPDMSGGDAVKFKEISVAYNVLSDSDRRKYYDIEKAYDNVFPEDDEKYHVAVPVQKEGMGGWSWIIVAIIIIAILIAINA